MEDVMESTVIKERQRVLFAVVDRLAAVHRDWVNSDAMIVTEALGNAVTACRTAFSTGMIPGKCRALNDRVATMMDEWEKWDQQNQLSRHETLPSNGFWKAFRNVLDTRKAAEPRPPVKLESIAELVANGVRDDQIARMYDWMDEDGSPQVWKVREEKAHPGKHTGGAPAGDRQQKERAAREKREQQEQEAKLARKVKAANATAPEGLAKLVEQGVSAQQIVEMLKMEDVEAVFAECDKAGIPRPRINYDLDVPAPAGDLPAEDKAEIDAILEEANRPLTLEQAVISRHLEGQMPAEIADALSGWGCETLTWQKVAGLIRRYERDPGAFGEIPVLEAVAAPVAALGIPDDDAEDDHFDGIDPFGDEA